MACGNKVLLAQIGLMKPGGLPPLLAALMSDPKVRKVGVGLDGDAVKLKTVRPSRAMITCDAAANHDVLSDASMHCKERERGWWSRVFVSYDIPLP